MSKWLLYAIVAAIVVVMGAWWYLSQPFAPGAPAASAVPQKIEQPSDAGLGGTIFEQAQPNPASNLPSTNPLKAGTNPYEGAYQNPFGQ